MSDIPATIPFLQDAYSPRPQYPDTGGQSFMKARELAQERQLKERELAQSELTQAVQRRVAEQSLKKSAVDLDIAIRKRDDLIATNEDFLGMKTLSDSLGETLNTPDGLANVTDYFMRHPKLIKNPDALELWKMVSTSTDARSRFQAAIRERAGAATDTAAIRNAAYLTTLRKDAEALRAKGDTAGYQSKQTEIAAMEEQIQKGQSFTAFDPATGAITAQMTSGHGGATTAVQTAGQKKLIGYETGIEGIRDVLGKLTGNDVGVKGWVGSNVFDTWVEQVKPGTRSTERIENRTALAMISEVLLETANADTSGRLSDQDAKRLRAISDSLGPSKSLGEIQDRLNEASRLLKTRARTWAQRTGQPIPDSTKTEEELVDEFKTQQSAIQKDYSEHRLNEAQATAEINSAHARIQSTIRRFYGPNAKSLAP